MGINAEFLAGLKRSYLASVTLFSLIVVMGSPSESAAQSATIGFTYNDYYDSGAGSFSMPISSNSNIGLSDLSAYQFTLNSAFFGGGSSFSYGLSDLSSFSLNFATPSPPLSNILSLQSNPVVGGYSYVSLSLNQGSATISDYVTGDEIYGGTVKIDQKSLNSAILQNSIKVNTFGYSMTFSPVSISAEFKPNFGLSLTQAATLMGFDNFNWVQTIISLPNPSPFFANNPGGAAINVTSESTPFRDPPPNGYTYNPFWNSYPFYWDQHSSVFDWSLIRHETNDTLSFFDSPGDPCISGPLGGASQAFKADNAIQALCGGNITPIGSKIAFQTNLVGVRDDGSVVDLGVGFTWTDNFNGYMAYTGTGGIGAANALPLDPSTGDGGITILQVIETAAVPELSTLMLLLMGSISMYLLRHLLRVMDHDLFIDHGVK